MAKNNVEEGKMRTWRGRVIDDYKEFCDKNYTGKSLLGTGIAAGLAGLVIGGVGTYLYYKSLTPAELAGFTEEPEVTLVSAQNYGVTFAEDKVLFGNFATETQTLVNRIYENQCKIPEFEGNLENVQATNEQIRNILVESKRRGITYTGEQKTPNCLEKLL